jgi:hypothetical protein
MFGHAGDAVLPAPTWLLAYLGLALVGLATLWAQSTVASAPRAGEAEPADSPPRWSAGLVISRTAGLAALVLTVVAAVVGPATPAGNLAPVLVLSIWWVGMPLVALLAGDVMRAINPFDSIAALARLPWRTGRDAPAWAGAGTLALFGWYLVAYHRSTDPREVAGGIAAYMAIVLAGALLWGRAWLTREEGFALVSRSIAQVRRGRTQSLATTATAAAACVWAGTTLFEALASTRFWVDVVGTSEGWSRTAIDSLGLAWMIAITGGVHLVAARVTARVTDVEPATAASFLAPAPLLIALAWLLAHSGPALEVSVQNVMVLASDPFGRGWDVFGTSGRLVDYELLSDPVAGRLQLAVLAVGHAAAVLLACRSLRRHLTARAAAAATWVVAAETGAAVVTAVLLLVGGGE